MAEEQVSNDYLKSNDNSVGATELRSLLLFLSLA